MNKCCMCLQFKTLFKEIKMSKGFDIYAENSSTVGWMCCGVDVSKVDKNL